MRVRMLKERLSSPVRSPSFWTFFMRAWIWIMLIMLCTTPQSEHWILENLAFKSVGCQLGDCAICTSTCSLPASCSGEPL